MLGISYQLLIFLKQTFCKCSQTFWGSIKCVHYIKMLVREQETIVSLGKIAYLDNKYPYTWEKKIYIGFIMYLYLCVVCL